MNHEIVVTDKTKKETGVIIEFCGKAWGVIHQDGQICEEGWVPLANAGIHDGRYLKKPEDATWQGSHYVEDLRKGRILTVIRTTTIEVQA